MPTYEYRCKDCEGLFEITQSFSDDSLTKCPGKRSGGPIIEACTKPGKGKVVKVFGSVGIAFKGDGFYKNDHGSKKPAAAGESSSSESSSSSSDSTAASSGAKSEKQADAKPDKPAKKADKKASASAD